MNASSLSKNWALSLVFLAGCAIHPQGESEERARAEGAGQPFAKVYEERDLPPLGEDPAWQEVLRHALVANGDLEARYWEWRAALEEIPQEASPKTTAAFFFNHLLEGGSSTFWDRTVAAVGNDPMFNLPWPGKLAGRGRVALEKARAAGRRFEKTKFDLQEKVLSAWFDWALLAESVRLQEASLALWETSVQVVEGRARAGEATQGDLLRARTERDLAGNRLESLRSRLPGGRARLNALLCRLPGAPLPLPTALPPPRRLAHDEPALLALIAERNPELEALARDVEGSREAILLARKEAIPDFALSLSTDLAGVAQSVAGMVTAPILRWEAIRAQIAQAHAGLRAALALRRQAASDLKARVVGDLAALRNAERQAALLDTAILPRAQEAIASTRARYAAAQAPLADLLDSHRTLVEARMLLAELRMEREKLLAGLEALAAVDVESPGG